jgi:hypothetical protein
MKFLTLSDDAMGIIRYIVGAKGPNYALPAKTLTDAVSDGQWLGMVGASQDEAEEIYNAVFGEGFEIVVLVEGGLAAFANDDELETWLAQV